MHSTVQPSGLARRLRVLIADDYAPMVTALERLVSLDCEVVGRLADGARLIAEVTRLQPDVLLLDLNLPGVNCLQACAEIRRQVPATRVIVLTGGVDPHLRAEVLGAGAAAFIEKNTAPEDLLAAITAPIP